MENMTRTEMVKESREILNQYKENCKVGHIGLAEKASCEGHGIYATTGEMVNKWILDKVLTMEEWDADKARRYKELNEAIDAIDATKKLAAKAKRYRAELEEIKARAEYLENWLKENEVKE